MNLSKIENPTPISKGELITLVSQKMSITKKQAREFIDILGDISRTELIKNGEFIFPGIGKLYLKKTNRRKVKHPGKQKIVQVPSRVVVKSSVFPSYKKSVLDKNLK